MLARFCSCPRGVSSGSYQTGGVDLAIGSNRFFDHTGFMRPEEVPADQNPPRPPGRAGWPRGPRARRVAVGQA